TVRITVVTRTSSLACGMAAIVAPSYRRGGPRKGPLPGMLVGPFSTPRRRASVGGSGRGPGADPPEQEDQRKARQGEERQQPERVEEREQGRLPDKRPVEQAEGRGRRRRGADLRRQMRLGVVEPALVRRIVRREVRDQARLMRLRAPRQECRHGRDAD